MLTKLLSKWRANREIRNAQRRVNRSRRRPMLETMEERLVPTNATYYWNPYSGNGWGTVTWNAGNSKYETNWVDGSGFRYENSNLAAADNLVPGISTRQDVNLYFGGNHGTDTDCNIAATYQIGALEIDHATTDYSHTLNLAGYTLTVSAATTPGDTYLYGTGAVDLNGGTLKTGDLQWVGGIVKSTSGVGTLDIHGGNSTDSNIDLSRTGTLDNTNLTVGDSTNPTVKCWLGGCASGQNLQVKDSANIDVYNGATLYFSQSSNNATSGGINNADGSNCNLFDGSNTFTGGTVIRELASRSIGDSPDNTAVVCNVPIEITSGNLTIGDELSLSVTGFDSNNRSVYNSNGALAFDGGNFAGSGTSTLNLSDNYYQTGSSARITCYHGQYHHLNDAELIFTGSTYNTATIAQGAVQLPEWVNGSQNFTQGGMSYPANGTLKVTGNMTFAPSSSSVTVELDLGIYGYATANPPFSIHQFDQLNVTSALTFTANGSDKVAINIVYGSGGNDVMNQYTFQIIEAGTFNGSLTTDMSWNYTGLPAGITLTPSLAGGGVQLN